MCEHHEGQQLSSTGLAIEIFITDFTHQNYDAGMDHEMDYFHYQNGILW